MTEQEAFETMEYITLDCLKGRLQVFDRDDDKKLAIIELFEDEGIMKIFIQQKTRSESER